MFPEIIIPVVIAAFILEFFDDSVGMGFGEITAVLLLLGFAPLEVIPSVILTSGIMSLVAGLMHHGFKNVNFHFKGTDFKVASILVLFGAVGIIVGALLALELPETLLRTYIGLLVMGIGIVILVKKRMKFKFSWKKIIGLGSLAAFNKGMTGGGYGPVLAGGQIISGVDGKKAVGITAITEGFVCIVGFITYYLLGNSGILNWSLISSLLLGGLLATPLAVYTVKKFPSKRLVTAIGIISIILGAMVLAKLFIP